jgi:HPt (histidine-containing phosphotransfer) domain-containing protein
MSSEDSTPIPLVDEAGLQSLVVMLGPALMREMIAACLSDVRESCGELQSASASSDGARVRRAAHKLAGVLAQYACPAGAAAARRVAEASDSDALRLSDAMLHVMDATAAELERRVQSPLSGSSGASMP